MKVLVNGIGNIGTTLINILADFKEVLKIDEIYALKNTSINSWNAIDLSHISNKGVKICTRNNTDNYLNLEDISNEINYIFDCTANGFGLQNKLWYEKLPSLIGCSAQGSEKGFGISFMSSINDEQILKQKYVHVVSCNTHAISSILSLFATPNLSELSSADFVIVRRSEDLGNHQRLVSANVISRHRSSEFGTHHAVDAIDLFRTKNIEPKIKSSDITTPSQLMHTVRFNIKLKTRINKEQIFEMIESNPYVSNTSKFDSNVIFEMGRKYSPYGRLYSHSIINANNVLNFENENSIIGWAFIPQEGNTILSTLHAYMLQTGLECPKETVNVIVNRLIIKEL